MGLTKNTSAQHRAFWRQAEESARRVALWPAWMIDSKEDEMDRDCETCGRREDASRYPCRGCTDHSDHTDAAPQCRCGSTTLHKGGRCRDCYIKSHAFLRDVADALDL